MRLRERGAPIWHSELGTLLLEITANELLRRKSYVLPWGQVSDATLAKPWDLEYLGRMLPYTTCCVFLYLWPLHKPASIHKMSSAEQNVLLCLLCIYLILTASCQLIVVLRLESTIRGKCELSHKNTTLTHVTALAASLQGPALKQIRTLRTTSSMVELPSTVSSVTTGAITDFNQYQNVAEIGAWIDGVTVRRRY